MNWCGVGLGVVYDDLHLEFCEDFPQYLLNPHFIFLVKASQLIAIDIKYSYNLPPLIEYWR
jgi:hypothetical protein